MEAQIFAMRSSSGDPHHVEVTIEDGRVSVNCSCPGAQMKTFCKHREAIVRGDDSMFLDDGHREIYFEMFSRMRAGQLGDAYKYLVDLLDLCEKDKKDAAARASHAKKEFAKLLSEGI